ncbi:PREDICTED: uncharacterized protein LOC104808553 [Tarenaya hassleriana]|uniref:uncharacterized protein LOC104808553 n=1 Tax=Tarenaya hassleriana TaxID=28532 RepID=UPI00053C5E6A|nr:PREDICTED: uncharacterized protein LOC104808553 [Tarenaya hassleriana]
MVWISVQNPSLLSYSLSFHLLILTQSLLPTPAIEKPDPAAMRVHPLPRKRNNILIHHHSRDPSIREPVKKLRRLPHIFNRVLELPFRSDADVVVEEMPDCFRFSAETDGFPAGDGGVRAHMVEIHPGVMKIVVRANGSSSSSLGPPLLDELELDVWRFRLPETTRPELVMVACEDGELVVTVPKTAENFPEEEEEEEGDSDGDFGGGIGSSRLVLVQ